jgi:HEAT repeat protein
MSSDNHTNHEPPAPEGATPQAADPGLPPVAPPSGRFIAQLFVVPGLIVIVLVLIWLAGHYLVAEKRSPDYFLRNLDSNNEDIRWRAASDLAQVLKRPESIELASDVPFALELTERLQSALLDLEQRERDLAQDSKLSEAEKLKAWNKLKPQRDYVLYLISSLGDFTVPVGAPLLCQIATKESAAATKENILRRRRAVWALANLGDKIKRFKKDLPEDKQQKALAALEQEQDKPGLRGDWAKAAYQHLTGKKLLGVDAALAKCAESDDSFLRDLVAHALNFWEGPQVIPTLEKLAKDDGHGTRLKIAEDEEHP